MEEKNKPVTKMKMKGKGKCEKGKNTLKKHRSSVARVEPSGRRMVMQNDDEHSLHSVIY